MILGVDVVSVRRFKKVKKADYYKWRHVFTLKEWGYSFKGVKSAEHLSSIFGIKEAFMKASGQASPDNYLDWEVIHTKSGKPEIMVKKRSIKNLKITVSSSHDAGIVVAVAGIYEHH